MPNKIIKEQIRTSPNFNLLSDTAEKHFYRLLTTSDDWGCFEATPAVVRGLCYPLQLKRVTETKITVWQQELYDRGIVGYWVDRGRVFGIYVNYDCHNKTGINDNGTQLKHRRKTPVEPQQLISFTDALEHLPTFTDKYCTPNPTPNPTHNPNPNILSGESPPDPIPYREIVEDLNQKTGKTPGFRWQSKHTQELIRGRWGEGYRLPDFQKVHDNKCGEWLNDPKWAKYLCPSTLYRASNFEKYLNQEAKHDPTETYRALRKAHEEAMG